MDNSPVDAQDGCTGLKRKGKVWAGNPCWTKKVYRGVRGNEMLPDIKYTLKNLLQVYFVMKKFS